MRDLALAVAEPGWSAAQSGIANDRIAPRSSGLRAADAAQLFQSENPLKPAANPLKDLKDKLMNILPGDMRFGAGQPVKRLEDQRLLTGKGQFIDDKPEDGALWLHVLRSPHAHARIVSIDRTAASEVNGVEAVYTGADLVADDIGTLPTLLVFQRPDGSPMTTPPRRLLAHEVVRFVGEPVAAVVATSRVAAQTAAEAIAVEYHVLPSVIDVDLGDVFAVLPEQPWWVENPGWPDGKPLEDGFSYSSDTNDRWLSVDELRHLLP